MEDQSVQPPETFMMSEQPVQAPRSNPFPLVFVAIISAIIFGFSGYILGKQSVAPQPVGTELLPSPSPVSEEKKVSTLPEGWTYTFSQMENNANECVTFGMPPIKEPYHYPLDEKRAPSVTEDVGSGRFWFLGGGSYPNMLKKIPSPVDYKQTMALFGTEEGTGGFISQAVVVSCIPNDGMFANNDALVAKLKTQLVAYNESREEKGMEPLTYNLKSATPAQRWGYDVVDLVVEQGAETATYTMFVTPKYIYEVKIIGLSQDAQVKATAQQIFDNLRIENSSL